MKICMPTIGKNGLNEKVYNHFGSASYFTIYDTETKNLEVVDNLNLHHNHGTCQPFSVISKYNVDAVLTSGMGRRAVQLLNSQGIEVYLLDGNTVAEAIKNFTDKKLVELTVDNSCGHHGCDH